jgi:diguanylate cyclase (GGDEF)-like protein/PAS domain S-box-containing protein
MTTDDMGRILRSRRPGLRAGVLAICAVLVLVTAMFVTWTVAERLRWAAVAEAVRHAEAVIEGLVGPMIESSDLADPAAGQAAVNAQLEALASSGRILRIKVWDAQGTVRYSDLPALRGRTFPVEEDLQEALGGEVATEFTGADAEENEFERGLADRFLSIYLPIRSTSGEVIGVYEVYEDAAPIEAQVEAARGSVLLLVGSMALALLAMLYAAFTTTARWLTRRSELLLRSEQRFRSLVQNAADVNKIVDSDGVITYESPAVQHVLGYRPAERVGTSALALIHPTDQAWARQLLADVTQTPGAQLAGEVRIRHADESWRFIEMVLTNLLDDPAVNGVVVNYRDISERRALEDELRHQALHDSLTGLANRALLVDRLDHAMARQRRLGHPLGVLVIDLDDLKTINASLGHGIGDRLLVSVAGRLAGVVRSGDTLARLGGDEFAVLVEDHAGAGQPLEVAERIMASLQPPFEQAGEEIFVRASVGLAIWSGGSESAADLLRNADASVNTAKTMGKNRIELFEPGMHAAALARLALKSDLERAMERREFFLRYQPIVRLADGRLSGVEALLRWRHPDRGVIEPAEFLAVLEETGLIVPLGEWVLEQACRQARAWDRSNATRGLGVSVNVSGRQLVRTDFVDSLRAIVRSARLAPRRLTLEFTESVLIRDTDDTIVTLAELKRLGFRLAIDDFGTGYSSLSYLRRLPIDTLKIDRSFIAGMAAGSNELAVVRSIVKLAEVLNLDTVAEGIERGEQLDSLRSMSADFGQGYLFAPPIDASDLEHATAEHRPVQAATVGEAISAA